MTATTASSATHNAAPRADQPEMCRVSIVAEHTQMDIALPSNIPVAALIPGLVTLTQSRRRSIEPQDPRDDPRTRWTLRAVGQPPLDAARSLAGQDVCDGALLMLGSEDLIDAEPLFDDVIDAVGAANAARFREWGPPASRALAQVVAIVAAGLAAILLADPLGLLAGSSAGLRAAVALAAGAAFMAASPIVARIYGDRQVGASLGYCALPLVFAGGALVPEPDIGVPGLLLGASFAACASMLCLRMSGAGQLVHTAAITTFSLLAVAAGAQVTLSVPGRGIGVALLLVAVAVLTFAPRLTILLARLPLPPVPSRDMPADLAFDGAQAPELSAGLGDRAARASALLSGLLAGAAVVAIAGGALTAGTGAGLRANGVCLALLVAAALMLRGRSYADLVQSSVLISGGVVLALAIIVLAISAEPQWTLYGVCALLAGAALALAVGVSAPTRAFSPVLQRAAEVFEYLVIAAIVPLALWVMGLYSMMRQL